MATATYTAPGVSSGTSMPCRIPAGSGLEMNTSTKKHAPITATKTMIIISKRLCPRRWTASIANDSTAVTSAEVNSPSPNRICMPTAAPRNSARSVAMAAASAAIHNQIRVRRVVWVRIAWGSVMPEAMPSLADSDWIRIAIRFDSSSTHSSM